MKQYEIEITAVIAAEDIDEAAGHADELCDIMVAQGQAVSDAYWNELLAAVGD